jgi:hypothetical protein
VEASEGDLDRAWEMTKDWLNQELERGGVTFFDSVVQEFNPAGLTLDPEIARVMADADARAAGDESRVDAILREGLDPRENPARRAKVDHLLWQDFYQPVLFALMEEVDRYYPEGEADC